MVESSVTFMKLIISEQKGPLLARQPLEEGTYWCFSFLGACYVLHVTFIFLKSSCAMGFQFPVPLLPSLLFEATSSPGAEFLFAFQNSFSIRSDPVRDHLIYRRSFSFYLVSNTDPAKSAVKVPLAPWSQFIFSLISIQQHN